MATRFYLPSTGAAAISPAVDAAWTGAPALRLAAITEKVATASSDMTGTASGSPENVCCVQYVSAPLAAQTVDGTVKGQAWCRESLASLDAHAQIVVRVVSGDGSTVRGTLLAAQAEALSSEWGSGLGARSRKFPLASLSPATLAPVIAQDGDRIVFEIGARVTAAVAGEVRVRSRTDAGSDLPEDETSNDIGDPWIELSATISFQSATPTTARKGSGLTPRVGVRI